MAETHKYSNRSQQLGISSEIYVHCTQSHLFKAEDPNPLGLIRISFFGRYAKLNGFSASQSCILVAAFLFFILYFKCCFFLYKSFLISLQLCLCLESSSWTLCSRRAGTTAWTTNGSGPLLRGGNRHEAGLEPGLNRSHSTCMMQQRRPRAIILALEMYISFFYSYIQAI